MALTDMAVLVPEDAIIDSLSQQAYYLLRDRIVTLQIPPGTLVNERDLIEEFGLGRTPLRDALRRLAYDGLVEVYPRRGVYVGPIDVGDLRDISEIRTELEGLVARLAAERATDGDRAAIAALLAELEGNGQRAGGRGDKGEGERQRRLIHLDQRIHRLIYRAGHNPFLESSLDRYYVLALRLWFLALERVRRLEDAVHEHHELLEAVAAGDADTAEERARRHVIEFEREIRKLL